MNEEIEICSYIPGTIGRVVKLHARYYSETWKFGRYFEAKVASEMAEFIGRFDEEQDGLWTICKGNRVEGAVIIDGIKARSAGAHLRWFIVSSELRGQGLGNRLLNEAVSFCRRKDYRSIYLWTFEGLDAARRLYEKFGFKLAEQREGVEWGTSVLEQRFVLKLI